MKTNKSGLIKRFLPYYKNHLPTLIFDLFCASLTTLCEIILPMIVRFITNTASSDISALTVGMILRCGAFYLVLRIIDTTPYYYMASIGHIM